MVFIVVIGLLNNIGFSYFRGVDSVTLSEIPVIISRPILALSAYILTSHRHFSWQEFFKAIHKFGITLVILVLIHMSIYAVSHNWYNQLERTAYFGADLNEFSILIVALTPLLVSHKEARKPSRLFDVAIFMLVLTVLLKTVSLSAFVLFSILVVLFIARQNRKTILPIVALFSGIGLSTTLLDTVRSSSIYRRLDYLSSSSSQADLSTGRFELWLSLIHI